MAHLAKLVAIRARPAGIPIPEGVGAILSPFDAGEAQLEAYRAIVGHDPPEPFPKGTEAYEQWRFPNRWLEKQKLK